MPLNVNTGGGILATTNFSPNEYELLADYTVDVARTSYTFSGLNINADEEIVLVSTIVNSSGEFRLFFNGNTTTTNYYVQIFSVYGTGYDGSRQNTPRVFDATNGSSNITNIKLTNNGYATYQTNSLREFSIGSSIVLQNWYGTSTFTLSQITSLTISSSVTSGIGIGSRFQLYKVKGQVQQTWATT